MVSFIAVKAHADVWFPCMPVEIMEFANPDDPARDRVHVKCSNVQTLGSTDPDNPNPDRATIRFIAIDKRQVAKVDRFLNLATTAFACGHIFRVLIPESADSNVPGCLESDCRTPKAFGVTMP
jgi:hypothetical protein